MADRDTAVWTGFDPVHIRGIRQHQADGDHDWRRRRACDHTGAGNNIPYRRDIKH